MIAAALLPACSAAWHRGVLAWVQAGWWSDLPAAANWPPAMWLGVPAALVTLAALITGAAGSTRALLIVLGGSAFVHPLLALVLSPMLLARTPRPLRFGADTLGAFALWLAGFLLTPACDTLEIPRIPLLALLRSWTGVLGASGLVLLLIEVAYASRRQQQLVALAVVSVAAGLLTRGWATDPAAFLGASSAVLAWHAALGGGLVWSWQTSAAGRLGATALLALVPVLSLVAARASGEPANLPAPERWAVLESAGSPAALIASGHSADTAAVVWRSGPSESQRSLLLIPPEPEAVSPHLPTRAVFAWDGTARDLAMRGMLVAPVARPGGASPVLWRVLQFEHCQPLTTNWIDVSADAAGGQIAGRFPVIEPGGALLYLSSARRTDPRAMDWPPEATLGLSARVFDRQAAEDATALAEALQRDGMSHSLGENRFVTRLRMDRLSSAPETLGVQLGSVVSVAWARRYVEGDARPDRQPTFCRSSVGLPVAAYSGAPAVVAMDVFSPFTVGGGWHGPEGEGDGRFRWTADTDADLLFVAHRPQPLVLQLDAQPGAPDWAAADLRVALNGTDAACRTGSPPCDWVLPVEAMRTGLNVISLHSTTMPAPPPEVRQLGLMVRGATLRRP